MDLNNLQKRLERIYLSIDKRFEKDLNKHVGFIFSPFGQMMPIPIALRTKEEDDNIAMEIILNIIHSIAALKDHLKRKIGAKLVEEEIEKSLALKVVIDIDNSDKHGYPLKISRSRSRLSPMISNPSINIIGEKGSAFKYSMTIEFKDNEKEFRPESKVNSIKTDWYTKVNAKVINSDKKLIMNFDDLITKSMEAWENIINSNTDVTIPLV